MTDPRANTDSIKPNEAFSTRVPTDNSNAVGPTDHAKVRTQPESSSIPEGTTRVVPANESLPQDASIINPAENAAQRTVDSGAAAGTFNASETLSGVTSGSFERSMGQPMETGSVGHGTQNDAKSGTVENRME